ncbi:hypothetical protein TWF569_002640 [Orbilia oligospora]|uniref:G-protein coupled receptors family 2 profile 2 domain-containing protein n=1 Tax=Orbilia oligospora TaxID=2813651 RepID=A0A7C8JD78_ORBOL|nr:hypothetical protein TWF102_001419 [Orbilia oligospora]KAF3106622.1 hypothetical protein TWF103_006113 [Orbilia oligospora]KAF3152815.1 hypothetical protein TWF569_002640 [Orbilia oligospora]
MTQLPYLLDRRGGALAAPATAWGDMMLNRALFSVALLSSVGSAWVVLSYACIKELRSYRHQLILGLAISDLLMALNFMFSAGWNVAGGDLALEESRTACSVNGFLTQVFVVQTDWWILVIAIATYIILGNFKTQSQFIQTHVWIPWVGPWVLSIIIAAICHGVLGYGYIGGWCWLTSDLMRLLVNFIPRWLIVIAIALIYIRLYMIVRKARKWDIEGVSPDPGDDMADTSVILVPVGKKDRERQGSGVLVSRDVSVSFGRKGSTAPTFVTMVTTSGAGDSREAISSCSAREEGSRARTVNVNSSRSLSLGMRQPLNAAQLKRIAKKMMVYPVAYAVIWACPTAIRIYQGTTGSRAPLWITIVDKSCIVIQGLVDAVVYGLNERAWQGWRDHIRRIIYKNEGGRIIG